MESDRIVERRRIYQQYKAGDVKRARAAVLPVLRCGRHDQARRRRRVIIGLEIARKSSTPGNHHTGEAGWLGKLYDANADPGHDQLRPASRLGLRLAYSIAGNLQVAALDHPRGRSGSQRSRRAAARIPFHRLRAERRPAGARWRYRIDSRGSIRGVNSSTRGDGEEFVGTELIGQVPSGPRSMASPPTAGVPERSSSRRGCLNCTPIRGGGGFGVHRS